MNDVSSHLTPAAAALLSESDERRIRAIKSRRWVLYPRAKQALDRLGSCLTILGERGCHPLRFMATVAWAKP